MLFCPVFVSLRLQIDLEPEGRVYVVIDLSGSSSEGKNSSGSAQVNECSQPHSGVSPVL